MADDAAPTASFTAFGLRAEAEKIAPGLHVVSTPIGNLKDISFRALTTLAAADAVIAEDTRVTGILLAHYGITNSLVAYHEHNAQIMRPRLIMRLQAGAALALVSDAGTPLVSDPGFKLVQEAIHAGIEVTAVPGPSAVLAALVVAGLPTDRFFFEGFLPHKSGPRRKRLADLAGIPGTLVFFESARRLAATLEDSLAALGNRQAAVARELTKYYEGVRRGSLEDITAALEPEKEQLKGEIVLLIAPPEPGQEALSDADLETQIAKALQTHSVKDAASVVSAATGLPRRSVYARALQLTANRNN